MSYSWSLSSWLTHTSELIVPDRLSAGISRSNDVIVIKSAGSIAERNDDDTKPLPRPETLARIRDVIEDALRSALLLLYSLPLCHLPTMDFIQHLWNSFKWAIFYVWFIYVLGRYINTFRFCFDSLSFEFTCSTHYN